MTELDTNPVIEDKAPEPSSQEKTFTQTELDNIIADRLKRASTSERSKLLESLGVESVEKLKSVLEGAEKARQAELSEIEKAKERETTLQAQIEQLKAEQTKAQAALVRTQVDSALTAALGSDCVDVSLALKAVGDTDFVKVDGTIDTVGIQKTVEELKSSKPYLFKTGDYKGIPSSKGGNAKPDDDANTAARKAMDKRIFGG